MEKLYSPSYVAAVHKRMHILHTVFNGGSRLFKESLPRIAVLSRLLLTKFKNFLVLFVSFSIVLNVLLSHVQMK
jgi:hypothetical protein